MVVIGGEPISETRSTSESTGEKDLRDCLSPPLYLRAPGPPPEKMVGVGARGLTTEPEDI